MIPSRLERMHFNFILTKLICTNAAYDVIVFKIHRVVKYLIFVVITDVIDMFVSVSGFEHSG